MELASRQTDGGETLRAKLEINAKSEVVREGRRPKSRTGERHGYGCSCQSAAKSHTPQDANGVIVIYVPWRRNAAIFDVLRASRTDDEQKEKMEGCGKEGTWEAVRADIRGEVASQRAATSIQDRARESM